MTDSGARPWLQIDDALTLEAAAQLLGQLLEVLGAERAAVAALDSEAMRELAVAKQAIGKSLMELASAATPGELDVAVRLDDAEHRTLRESVRRLTLQVRAHSLANAALLSDAVDAVNEALGLRDGNATYDRRARLRGRSRFLSEHAA